MKYFILLCALTFCVASGCHSNKLEGGGVYAPVVTNSNGSVTTNADMAFFAVDSAFDVAYASIDGIFKFEKDNREALWSISHDIKHKLDEIRPIASDIVKRYLLARRVYIANPLKANLTQLQTILADIQRLAQTAIALTPK